MRAPVLAALFLIITLANLAMPGTANFMGEFYILIGVFQSKIVFAFVASIGVVFAAYYAIRLFQRTMQNRRTENSDSREIGLRDALVIGPLVACIVALALYPGFILGRTDTSVKDHDRSDLPAPAALSPRLDWERGDHGLAEVPWRSVRQERRPTAPLTGSQPGWTGYAPIGQCPDDLHRPAHRLRRALPRHRPQRRHRRRAPGRRPERPSPETRGIGAVPYHARHRRRPLHLAVGDPRGPGLGCVASRRAGPRRGADRDVRGRGLHPDVVARPGRRPAGRRSSARGLPGAAVWRRCSA